MTSPHPTPQPVLPADRTAVHAALLGWSTLARHRPQREWEEHHGPIVLHASERPGPELNYALVLDDAPPETVLSTAERFFGTRTSYAVILDIDAAPALTAALDEAVSHGTWELDEEEPAMVLSPLPAPAQLPRPPAELTIRSVDTPAAFESFFQVSGGGGGRFYVPSLEAALDPSVSLLLGVVDGTAVATSRIACVTGATDTGAASLTIAEITGVVTLPSHRRLGYGTAMTWAAVAEGVRRGATAAVLNASEMGAPVYRKMGFRYAGTYRTYVPAPTPE